VHVYVYVCLYVCMSVCMCAYKVCVRLSLSLSVCAYVCMYMCVHTRVHVGVGTSPCVCAWRVCGLCGRGGACRTHMYDLIETTRAQYYEEYRTDAISAKREKKAAKKSGVDKPKSKGQ
jgi:hypothetical protein